MHQRVDDESVERRSSEEEMSTTLQTSLITLILLQLVAIVIFFSLFLTYYFKYRDLENFVPEQHVLPCDAPCDTPSCVIAAASLAEKMDTNVDPCKDFDQYACGNFYKTAIYTEGQNVVKTFSSLRESNDKLIKAILNEDNAGEEWNYMKHMRNYYAACMDEAKIDEMGVEPYLDSSFAAQWPTLLGETWSAEAAFDLNDLIEQFELVYIEKLFAIDVSTHLMNSSAHMLKLYDPTLGLPQRYLVGRRSSSLIQAYEKYLVDVAVELGADRAVAQRDVTDVVDLEIELAKIIVPRDDRKNLSKEINPMTITDLGKKYTFVDIPRALRAAFSTVNIILDDDQVVNVNFPTFFDQLEKVIAGAEKRTLQNLFSMAYAVGKVSKLTTRLREIEFEFDKVYRSKTEESPRWEKCQKDTLSIFSLGISKEFVRRKFSEKSKKYVVDMVSHLRESFRTILDAASWMKESTKTKALEKLAAMKQKIGYPDVNFGHEDIEKKYKELVMTSDNYYNNRVVYTVYENKRDLRKLKTTVDKHSWLMSPYEVNAYYSPTANEIVFLAGILQPPFFSDQFPDPMNYGAIGVTIGHEITHGFDNIGRRFDKNGSKVNWWHADDLVKFQKKSQCLVDQYNAYRMKSVGMNVSGSHTLGENIADNGGLKESYMAYQKLVTEKGQEKPLPGLGLTNNQLFFLGYSQLLCEKMTRGRRIDQIGGARHSPGRYRIIGPLRNSKEFSEAYKCAKGTYMNPEAKCSVW